MTREEILRRVDHTILKVDATWKEVQVVGEDALAYHTASVCIPPLYVKQAVEHFKNQIPICTVIGFPNGYTTTEVKQCETKQMLENGATEIDMVIPIGKVKEGLYDEIEEEIKQIKNICKQRILKVIVEACLLTLPEKEKIVDVVVQAGADYIKTSTGFSAGGATIEDVKLFAQKIKGRCKIKAAGGIATFEMAERLIEAGADRIGASKLVAIQKTEESRRREKE